MGLNMDRVDRIFTTLKQKKHSVTCVECRYHRHIRNQILAGIIDKSDEKDEILRNTIAVTKICSSKFRHFKLEDVENKEDGTISKKSVPYLVCLDQTLDDGNRQGTVCVVSLLDAALKEVSIDIPSIKSIIL